MTLEEFKVPLPLFWEGLQRWGVNLPPATICRGADEPSLLTDLSCFLSHPFVLLPPLSYDFAVRLRRILQLSPLPDCH